MNVVTLPIEPAAAKIAAALHRQAGLLESWDAQSFAALLASPGIEGRFALAGTTNEPVGLVLWRVAADEAEILTICVSPERRRLGIGRILLEAALAAIQAHGAVRIFLEVAIDNVPAEALYREFGFRREGFRTAYYRTASGGTIDAAILMRGVFKSP